jgi:micrococcal nuclease
VQPTQVLTAVLFAGIITAGVASPITGFALGDAIESDSDAINEGVPVTVTEVTDGDTVSVEYADGSTATVRLLGVDTPEIYAENMPEEFEGVPVTDTGAACLQDAGEEASQYATTHLLNEKVQLRFDEESENRGGAGRVLGYLYVDGENFNHDLVETGHARVYDAPFSLSDSFYSAEEASQRAEQNLWSCRTSDDDGDEQLPGDGDEDEPAADALAIDWINADADDLNDERVKLTNAGDGMLDLSGFRIEDEAGAGMTFAEGFTLDSGDSVYVHTGSGENDHDDRYIGRNSELWDDEEDTATVYHNDRIVAQKAY